MISYPSGEITLYQFRRLVEGNEPSVTYVSYDGSVMFHLMGPLAPVPGVQEGLTVTEDSIKGLIASWQTLDQAGANQDGVTFSDAVYQPAEIDMVVEAHGRTPAQTRTVIRDWIASWDAHKQGELRIFTPEQGEWWAPVRWIKAPMDPLANPYSNRQRFVWTCRIDDAFWRSYDSVSDFGFQYESMKDTFDYGSRDDTDLGENWPLRYIGADEWGGYIYADGDEARWRDSVIFFTETRSVVAGPFKDFSTATDNQVISTVMGVGGELSLRESGANDIWGRMGRNEDGTWDGHGIRLRMNYASVELHRFNGFVTDTATANVTLTALGWTTVPGLDVATFSGEEQVYALPTNTGTSKGEWLRCRIQGGAVQLRNPGSSGRTIVSGDQFRIATSTRMASKRLGITPLRGEKWTLVCGYEGDPRLFKVMRNKQEVLAHKESGTGSMIGSAYRGIGFGMLAGGSLIAQSSPSRVREISAGDNATVSQSGHLPLTNNGEIEAWPRYLLYGPGYFSLGNGPDNPDTVEFGPLLDGQVVLIETEPRRRSVVDLTPSEVPTSPQVLKPFQQLIKNLVSFAFNNNTPPLLQEFESLFGVMPPQGNLYSYLSGRFTKAVPAKPPAQSPTTSSIKVSIDDGNANSKVVAALTPRRRWPL